MAAKGETKFRNKPRFHVTHHRRFRVLKDCQQSFGHEDKELSVIHHTSSS